MDILKFLIVISIGLWALGLILKIGIKLIHLLLLLGIILFIADKIFG